jgi:hypothetical protein
MLAGWVGLGQANHRNQVMMERVVIRWTLVLDYCTRP